MRRGEGQMSNTLRQYKGMGADAETMYVNAFVGGEYGACCQFTMQNGGYCCLSENQVRDLISVLQKRIRRVKRYQATSSDLDEVVYPERVKDD
jgi:hypothetical protein